MYRLADKVNGPYGSTIPTWAQAFKELLEAIDEGNNLNAAVYQATGEPIACASTFLCIVDTTRGDDLWI